MNSVLIRFWRRSALPRKFKRVVDKYVLFSRMPVKKRKDHYPSGVPVLAGFLQSGFGIAQAARLEVQALRQGGLDFDLLDLSVAYDNQDLKDPNFISTPCPSLHGPLLLHVNAPEVSRSLRVIGKKMTADRPIIGLWAWELAQPHPDWHLAYPCLDELWVPSNFVAGAFRLQSPIPVRVVPHPVSKPAGGGLTRSDLGLPESRCIFLAMADGRSDLERKNLLGTVRAFQKAFGDRQDVMLVLKLHHVDYAIKQMALLTSLIVDAENIRIINQLMDRPTMTDLMMNCDVFISLHRAEGFGLTLAEAMLLGKPVVATAYSGNMDFMPANATTLIGYTLVNVVSDNPGYDQCREMLWAEPDIAQAAEVLRRLADDPGFRLETARMFAERAEAFFQPQHFCQEIIALQKRFSATG